MSSKVHKFITALVATIVVGIIAVAALRSFGILVPAAAKPQAPETLIQEATNALQAVRTRKITDRRPASYDSILSPLDKLLKQCKEVIESPTYNPVSDFEKLRAIALPIMDLATQAEQQASSEIGFLAKDYRFNAQKGEAAQYLASAMWERINSQLPAQTGFFSEVPQYPPHEMVELRRLLDEGVAASPDNPHLFYIRGVVNRAEGLFGPAARDLERATELDKEFVSAWNTLGLVRINLKEFNRAEEALERARALALDHAQKLETEPGPEHTAILYNLASFHEGLSAYYTRENRISPTVESHTLMAKHATEARPYLEEFLRREPSSSPDYKAAAAKLQSLGK